MAMRISSSPAVTAPKQTARPSSATADLPVSGGGGRTTRPPVGVRRQAMPAMARLESMMATRSTAQQPVQNAQANRQKFTDDLSKNEIKMPSYEEMQAARKVAEERQEKVQRNNTMVESANQRRAESAAMAG